MACELSSPHVGLYRKRRKTDVPATRIAYRGFDLIVTPQGTGYKVIIHKPSGMKHSTIPVADDMEEVIVKAKAEVDRLLS